MERLEEVVARLVEKVEGRHYGKYRGVVTRNDDPQRLGRIRTRVPRLLDDVELGWALPCAPYGGRADQGLFAVPDVGASVWVEFEAGDLDSPVWSGTWWGDGEIPTSAGVPHKVLRTASGAHVVLDDDEGSVTVGDGHGNTVRLTSDGIALDLADGTTLTLTSAGLRGEDVAGNRVETGSAGITLQAGGVVSVGDPASDSLVGFLRLNTALSAFATQVAAHVHTGNLGAPTGPPVPPPVLDLSAARSKHRLEM